MSTRSLIIVHDDSLSSLEICTIYKHWDGYPQGLGQILFDNFNDFEIVNGLDGKNPRVANGMGCLAAQIITVLKNLVLNNNKDYGMAGDVLILPTGTRDCGEEYIYTFYCNKICGDFMSKEYDSLMLRVEKKYFKKIIYEGPISQFGDWIKSQQEIEN